MTSILKSKKEKIVVLCLWPVLSALVSFQFNINSLESMFFFLLIPCIYLSVLLPGLVKKSLTFSVITGLSIMIVLDYTMHATAQWFLPTVFPFRVFTLVPIEDLIWAVLSIYLVVMFYEYFLDNHRERKVWRPKMTRLSMYLVVMLVIFFTVYTFYPVWLAQIPYAYLIFGVVITLIPLIIECLRRPVLIPKLCAAAGMFFFYNLIYEITALKLGWWTFPSHQYIGMVSLAGVSFPLEEFFFWFMVLSPAILAYYEAFDDDEK